jgi:hypothetical protein
MANAIKSKLADISCSYLGIDFERAACPIGTNFIQDRISQIQVLDPPLDLPNFVKSFSQELSFELFKGMWSQFSDAVISLQQGLNDYEASNLASTDLNSSCANNFPSSVSLYVPEEARVNCFLLPYLVEFLQSIAQPPFIRVQYASVLGDYLAVDVPGDGIATAASSDSDRRTQPWFTTASGSRRDIIIMLDMSPSVRMGSNATGALMLAALDACLASLSPQDYYQVILVASLEPRLIELIPFEFHYRTTILFVFSS